MSFFIEIGQGLKQKVKSLNFPLWRSVPSSGKLKQLQNGGGFKFSKTHIYLEDGDAISGGIGREGQVDGRDDFVTDADADVSAADASLVQGVPFGASRACRFGRVISILLNVRHVDVPVIEK
jgi:hypothetical protein